MIGVKTIVVVVITYTSSMLVKRSFRREEDRRRTSRLFVVIEPRCCVNDSAMDARSGLSLKIPVHLVYNLVHNIVSCCLQLRLFTWFLTKIRGGRGNSYSHEGWVEFILSKGSEVTRLEQNKIVGYDLVHETIGFTQRIQFVGVYGTFMKHP
jgi:hypothetical protein